MEIYSVTEALFYLKVKIECDDRLTDLWLEGEVSNCKRNPSGHYFFDLKDSTGRVACALFKNASLRQTHLPRDGSNFVMHGYLAVYEAQGKLQFYVDTVQPAGIGKLYLEFEALKQRLAEEGLFSPERKRPLPVRPRKIGIVTSPGAAAFQDILNVLSRRYPLAEIVLSPTQVQGEAAPPQIVMAIRALNTLDDIDVIIVARGGGSIEDLWAFNDERVARAVFASRIPVVTGVGHEVDTTIVDYVADLRAPTPSAAAELVAPDLDELRGELAVTTDQLYAALQSFLDKHSDVLDDTQRRLRQFSPANRLPEMRDRVAGLIKRSEQNLNQIVLLHRVKVGSLSSQIKVLNPRQILERGYAIVTRNDDGSVISQTGQVQPGDQLQVRVKDGTFSVTSNN